MKIPPSGAFTLLAALLLPLACARAEEPLASTPVRASSGGASAAYEGVVESTRQTVVASQVAGTVQEILVRPGDAVRAGQVLARLDARAAEQTAAASAAQVQAARAALDLAQQDFERQRQLFEKQYISQGAFDRARAQVEAARAQAQAQQAQAGAARTQSGYYVVTAPYAGRVAQVPVNPGDMAMPGRALVELYDPASLRVTVQVPQSALAAPPPPGAVRLQIGGAEGGNILSPVRVQVLPAADPATHTLEVRLELPRAPSAAVPGSFARAWLPGSAPAAASVEHLFVPRRSVLERVEFSALYVLDEQGRPQLRQVRLGEPAGDEVEVLSGVRAQDRVALDPAAAAARLR